MCTIVILRRFDAGWPVVLAANRDEMTDRPWRSPARHWPDRPEVVGGLDSVAGGSWLGLNDTGVVAAALNRFGTLGPAAGKRSRGELVLEALDHGDAVAAATALADLNPRAYRPFNLVIADDRDAFCLYHRDDAGRQPIEVAQLPEGLSLITAFDRNDPSDPRIRTYLSRFEQAAVPDPETGDWNAWQALLACRDQGGDSDPRSAMCFTTPGGFATGSSALIALPATTREAGRRPVWLFTDGPPDRTPWRPVTLNPAFPSALP
jgi:hypothetical protein